MKRITESAVQFGFMALIALPLQAAEMNHTPDMKMEASKTVAQVHKGRGTVKGVDANAGKVSLSHGAIASLNWPAMTMDFQVKDKAVLKGLKPGQDVEFDVAQAGQNRFLITRIAPAARK